MARVWLDLTGLAPGSDGAVFAAHLGPAMALRCELRFCRRMPGLVEVDGAFVARMSTAAPPIGGFGARTLRQTIDRLPPGLRTALGRFARLQLSAMGAWRSVLPRSVGPVPAPGAPVDSAPIRAGDVLLMLAPAGDAARFAERGVRLALYEVVEGSAAEAAIWDRTTRGLLDTWITCDGLHDGVPGASTIAAVAPERRDLVLCLDEIGLCGRTGQLLQAWRLLLDAGGADRMPRLVLAGPIGRYAADVLSQISNSRGFGGAVTVEPFASPARRAALLAQARFAVAVASPRWPRGAQECATAGVALLQGEPGNATALARSVREWMERPPSPGVPDVRVWGDVADDLLAKLAS